MSYKGRQGRERPQGTGIGMLYSRPPGIIVQQVRWF